MSTTDTPTDQPPKKKRKGNPNFYKGMPPLKGAGRPKGSLNKYTELSRALMTERGPEIVEKVIEMAMEGDRTCLKMCLDRVLPPKRDVDIKTEGAAAINIVVEQIGQQAQQQIEDVGGEVIEHDPMVAEKAEKKEQDKAFQTIAVEVMESKTDD